MLPLNTHGLSIFGIHDIMIHLLPKYKIAFKTGIITSLAYVIMAQLLAHNAPMFCLCIFGTDNKFHSDHILKRWVYIVEYLKKEQISVFGILL